MHSDIFGQSIANGECKFPNLISVAHSPIHLAAIRITGTRGQSPEFPPGYYRSFLR